MKDIDNLVKKFPVAIIKIGGRPSRDEDCMRQLAAEIGSLLQAGMKIAVVHGGGAQVTKLSEKLGITARFTDGIRATGPDDMLIADQVLAGEVNTSLVRLFSSCGIAAVGLTGCDADLCTAEPILEHTAQAGTIKADIITILWQNSLLPVLASVSQDKTHLPMNINADEFAQGLAAGLHSAAGPNKPALIYISDIPGIKIRGDVVDYLTPATIEKEIESGEIQGGMIAKTRAAVKGLQQGIGTVCIGDYAVSGDLVALLTGIRGSRIGTH